MFSTELKLFNKCIFTNVLPLKKWEEYTSGILLLVENNKNTIDTVCSVLLTYHKNKPIPKPQIVKVVTPPIVCKDLIKTDIYSNCDGFLIGGHSIVSYLDMSNIDFLNIMYAKICTINKIFNNYAKPNILINSNVEIKNFYTKYKESAKVNTKTLGHLVDSKNKRSKLIYNILLIESFVKTSITRPFNILNFLNKHLQVAIAYEQTALIKKLKDIIYNKNPEKMLSTLQENEDVLYRYKNSGYWI